MVQVADALISAQFSIDGEHADYLAVGWAAPDRGHSWSLGDESTILFDCPTEPGDYVLEIECFPFLAPGKVGVQRVHLVVNRWYAGLVCLEAPGRLACRIGWDVIIAAGPRVGVTLILPDACRPSDIDPGSDDRRRIALAVTGMRLSRVPEGEDAAKDWAAKDWAAKDWHLSAPRIVHGAVENGMTPSPEQEIEAVRMLAGLGRSQHTIARLDDLIARLGVALFAFPRLMTAVLDAAFQLAHFDGLTAAIRRQYQVSIRLALDAGNPDLNGTGAALWSLAADGSAEFRFRQALARHPFRSLIFDNWAKCLPVYARYMRLPERASGHTWVNLEHMGTFPGIAFCDFRRGFHLMMDPNFIGTNAYADVKRHYAEHAVPWQGRQAVALWRGRLTGSFPVNGPFVEEHWRNLQRTRLCEHARVLGKRADVGLTGIVSVQDPQQIAEIEASGLLRPVIHWRDFQDFRYHIDIDGHTSSWSGLFARLCSGSVVVKVTSPVGFRQWYYDRLTPWRNYVPVEADMSDLAEKIDWLREHDEQARAIGEAGRELACSMTMETEGLAAEDNFRRAFLQE